MNLPWDIAPAASAAQAGDPRMMAGQLGREITSPLASALDRVTTLVETGKIRSGSLRALREELEQALRAGTAAQQLCQLINDKPRCAPEPMDLKSALGRSLAMLDPDPGAEPQAVEAPDGPVLVLSDPRLTDRLLMALAQWAMCRGEGRARWSVQAQRGQAATRLVCSAQLSEPAQGEDAARTIDWRLVEVLCSTLEVRLQRRDARGMATVTVDFPRAAGVQSVEGILVEELSPDDEVLAHAQALTGVQLLIVAGRAEARERVHEAVKALELATTFAVSVEEARQLCEFTMPHAIVHEPRVRGVPFEPLRIELLSRSPRLVSVEIVDEDSADNVHHEIRPRHRVMRRALAADLPPLLMAELVRALKA